MGDERTKTEGERAVVAGSGQSAPSTIASDGVDVARAYVGPTAVPVSHAVRVDGPKVKVNDPRREATVRLARVRSQVVPDRQDAGSIHTPADRPASAFQPVAADPALIQEWMARRGEAANGGQAGASGGLAANEVGGAASRWETTAKVEKIDRGALPSAHAPNFDREEATMHENVQGARVDGVYEGERVSAGRSIWVPLIVTVGAGLVIGVLVIKFFLLPSVTPREVSPLPTVPSVPAVTARSTDTGSAQGVDPVGASTASSLAPSEPVPSVTAVTDPSPVASAISVGAPPVGVPSTSMILAPPPVRSSPSSWQPRPSTTARPTAQATAAPTPTHTSSPVPSNNGDPSGVLY
jgi:hypothetical protein